MTSWPAISSEPMVWSSHAADGMGPGLTSYLAGPRRYRAAVPADIARLTVDLPGSTRVGAEEAALELGRFDAELGDRVAGFGPVLLRSEAAASSQIEQLTASARAIFTAELGARSASNATQIAQNTASLIAAIELSDQITSESIRQMHAVLMADLPRHTPGEWRQEPVWIGTSSQSPVGADFVAPRFERVPGLIADLTEFARRTDVPPLVLTAIAHAQFETIHPFTDGNGRTGRALAQALLRYRSVTRNVAVPVSAGLLADVDGYHQALTAYRAGDLEPIIGRFAEASVRAVINARELVADIDQVIMGWRDQVRARRDSGVWQVLDVVARSPVINIERLAQELGRKPTNIYPLLQELTDQGVLVSKAEYRGGRLWRNDEILHAIDRFAERSGRREPPTLRPHHDQKHHDQTRHDQLR